MPMRYDDAQDVRISCKHRQTTNEQINSSWNSTFVGLRCYKLPTNDFRCCLESGLISDGHGPRCNTCWKARAPQCNDDWLRTTDAIRSVNRRPLVIMTNYTLLLWWHTLRPLDNINMLTISIYYFTISMLRLASFCFYFRIRPTLNLVFIQTLHTAPTLPEENRGVKLTLIHTITKTSKSRSSVKPKSKCERQRWKHLITIVRGDTSHSNNNGTMGVKRSCQSSQLHCHKSDNPTTQKSKQQEGITDDNYAVIRWLATSSLAGGFGSLCCLLAPHDATRFRAVSSVSQRADAANRMRLAKNNDLMASRR